MTSASANRLWTRDEHILAFNLYLTMPFGRMHRLNPAIIEVATLLGRSPNAVAMKLGNFARLDPSLQARGIRGMSHGAAGEEDVWNEFIADREALTFESERLRANLTGTPIEQTVNLRDLPADIEGREREAIVKVRVNQNMFRKMMLAYYDGRCCVTGLTIRQLLVASHIIPWADAPDLRLNPRNGLCLNALHDRAFEVGLLTITDDMRISVAPEVNDADPANADFLLRYDNQPLMLPDRFAPDPDLIRRHRERFRASGAA